MKPFNLLFTHDGSQKEIQGWHQFRRNSQRILALSGGQRNANYSYERSFLSPVRLGKFLFFNDTGHYWREHLKLGILMILPLVGV